MQRLIIPVGLCSPEVRNIGAVIRTDSDGSYWAEVAELPGCFASGLSFPEVMDALEEAVMVYLDEREKMVMLTVDVR